MHVRVVRPEVLRPEDLDGYLALGWFRIGQAMMTCRVVLFDGQLRPSVWTRLPLDGFVPSKNSRKLLARNLAQYTLHVGSIALDEEHEALYQRYRGHARGDRSPTLDDFLYGDSERDVFDTRELSLRDGSGALVAFSWFDVGRESLQSLLGVYEPDRASDSLGLTTLLAEARWASDHGLRYHYPGYVLPGDRSMDYKLRLGQRMEFLDPFAQAWRTIGELPTMQLPTTLMEDRLEVARRALAAVGVRATLRRYPWFEAPAWQPDLSACVDQPMLLECFPERAGGTFLAVTYDLDHDRYGVMRCLRARAVTRGRTDVETPIELWLVAERIGTHPRTEELAREVVRRGLDRLPLKVAGLK
jgi:arginyl-tRNA--protein-N-Asp/Glu arginylyltransferase